MGDIHIQGHDMRHMSRIRLTKRQLAIEIFVCEINFHLPQTPSHINEIYDGLLNAIILLKRHFRLDGHHREDR